MGNNERIADIWSLYGVKENPFLASPLLVIGGAVPIESFVGRVENIRRLNKILGSRGGSRSLVFGDFGVGKTSFVNVVRHSAMKMGYFTPVKEIAVLERWDADDFVLNTLAAIYSTLKLFKEKECVGKDTMSQMETLFEIGRSDINIGISIAGFGGNYDSEKKTGRLTSFGLQDFFNKVISEVIKNTGKEVIIHYNNLELLSEKKLRYLFENLRDFFQVAGVHFIFVGNLTVYSSIQSMPRFAHTLTDTPFNIEALTFEEVEEVIKKRFKALRIGSEVSVFYPYTHECLKILFDLMDGNLRYILNSLSTAVVEATDERPILFDKRQLAITLKSVLESRYLSKLKHKERIILDEIVKHKEITNKALSDKLKIPRPHISGYMKDLMNQGCVYLRRKNGKDKYWSADPKIRWSLLSDAKSPQRSLYNVR